MEPIIRDLGDPGNIFAHLSYIFLISSMLMTSLRALRILALASGIAAMIHFTFQTQDNASFVWETVFVLANGTQLAILLYRSRTGDMLPEERELFDYVMSVEEPSHQRRLRDLLEWKDIPVGEVLMQQGARNPPLIYIASGAASIEHSGAMVGVCGPGDFVGEMSLISGESASATVTVTNAMRIARFDRDALSQLVRNVPDIGKAFDSALNRGLAAKVLRMNEAAAAS